MSFRAALFASLMAAAVLTGCQGSVTDLVPKAEKPLPEKIIRQMKAKGMSRNSPILVRIFKEEGELEVWKQKDNGRYDKISSYEICKWSGKLGPKFVEGDRQAPEGFYTVRPGQMNPNSQYHLAFNMGFPNAYDQANGRTGQHLMVHGACSSAGCYSMTDESVEEIYAFGRDAFKGGQRDFQIQAFPFRMTAANMARYRNDPNYEFWKMLKQGYDIFEITKIPPKVDVCEKRYVFNQSTSTALSPTGACPTPAQNDNMSIAFSSYNKTYDNAFKAALEKKPKPPAPSIAGLAEAKLVAQWSAARARGERVSREPPSLTPATAETPNAPDIAPASTPAPAPASAIAEAVNPPVMQTENPSPAATPSAATGTIPTPGVNPVSLPGENSANSAISNTVATEAASTNKKSGLLGVFGL